VSDGSALFRHYGVSPWEIEVIFDTLRRAFQVQEEQLRPDDSGYVSMIEIRFPVPYDEAFFQQFTMESWYKIKGVLKDIKRRRGKKGLKSYLRFAGVADKERPILSFPLFAKNERPFEMGIEKLEYPVDIIPLQLKELPSDVVEIEYNYDEESFKWHPYLAKKSDGINYTFKDDSWKTK